MKQRRKLLLILALIVFGYIFSIVWRVSVAEQQLFGRSDLIPMTSTKRPFDQASVPGSFGSPTYVFEDGAGRKTIVWKEKINSFQHAYGSALMAYEVGTDTANFAFCLNEHLESHFDPRGLDDSSRTERLKDLWQNQLGRAIGQKARNQDLPGPEAERFILEQIRREMHRDSRFVSHPLNPKLHRLANPKQLGCPALPHESLWNDLQRWRRQP